MTSDVIDQAIENLIDHYDIDADAAFASSRRLSTRNQEPVTDVARRLIETYNAPTKDSSRGHAGGGSMIGRRPRV